MALEAPAPPASPNPSPPQPPSPSSSPPSAAERLALSSSTLATASASATGLRRTLGPEPVVPSSSPKPNRTLYGGADLCPPAPSSAAPSSAAQRASQSSHAASLVCCAAWPLPVPGAPRVVTLRARNAPHQVAAPHAVQQQQQQQQQQQALRGTRLGPRPAIRRQAGGWAGGGAGRLAT